VAGSGQNGGNTKETSALGRRLKSTEQMITAVRICVSTAYKHTVMFYGE
jgi:hypothetical protein